MNRSFLISLVAAATALVAAAPAHATLGAGEGVPGYAHENAASEPASALGRAQVRAEAARALAERRITSGEATPEPAPALAPLPVPTRAQVRAEAAEAVRQGVVSTGEAAVVYTTSQLTLLRKAGERAGTIVVDSPR